MFLFNNELQDFRIYLQFTADAFFASGEYST